MSRTSKEQSALIERLAAESFKDHVLTKRDDGTWRCAKPGTGIYSFNVFAAPGVVFVWGDIGEFAFRHSDANGLAWWLYAGSRDYFLEKLRACDDGAKKEFMFGDAMAHLLECERERRKELDEDREAERPRCDCPTPPDGEGCRRRATVHVETEDEEYDACDACADRFAADDVKRTPLTYNAKNGLWGTTIEDAAAEAGVELDPVLDRIAKVREAMSYVSDATPSEQSRAWWEAWCDQGNSDPPECEGWKSGPLWCWEAAQVFRRLYAAMHPDAPKTYAEQRAAEASS